MGNGKLLYEIKDDIGWIRFNKPELLNAFTPEEARALVATLQKASDDDDVKVIMTRAPLAVVNYKRMLQNASEAGFGATLEAEKQTIINLIYTEDYGEAVTAFGEKRTPKFKGR